MSARTGPSYHEPSHPRTLVAQPRYRFDQITPATPVAGLWNAQVLRWTAAGFMPREVEHLAVRHFVSQTEQLLAGVYQMHGVASTQVMIDLQTALDAIAVARSRPTGDRYELEDTVLRGIGWAEDIGTDAAPLHAQAAQIIADEEAAREAARIAAEANPSVPFAVSLKFVGFLMTLMPLPL